MYKKQLSARDICTKHITLNKSCSVGFDYSVIASNTGKSSVEPYYDYGSFEYRGISSSMIAGNYGKTAGVSLKAKIKKFGIYVDLQHSIIRFGNGFSSLPISLMFNTGLFYTINHSRDYSDKKSNVKML